MTEPAWDRAKRISVVRGGVGDGLVARLVVPQAMVQAWLGEEGRPSATARLTVQRELGRDLGGLLDAVVEAMAERERARLAPPPGKAGEKKTPGSAAGDTTPTPSTSPFSENTPPISEEKREPIDLDEGSPQG